MSRLPVVILILLIVIAPVGATPGNNLLGGEIGYALKPFGAVDPYSSAIGGGAFYERHAIFSAIPLMIGAGIHLYGFYPSDEFFLTSAMFRGDLYVGYEFTIPFHTQFSLSITPYAGYSHYIRSIRYANETVRAYRPVLKFGVIVDADVWKGWIVGQNLSGTVILDNRALFSLGQAQRLAWRF